MNTPTSARIHVLLAQKSPQAIILRRGPSERVATIGWNRANDKFSIGQWLKGRIFSDRCDISPDGRHWIYFAMGSRSQTWTAVAKTPYLKALDFYPLGNTWAGGGLFESNRSYWVCDACSFEKHQRTRHLSGLSVSFQCRCHDEQNSNALNYAYFIRLVRDGWNPVDDIQSKTPPQLIRFNKRINDYWQLWKLCHYDNSYFRLPGKAFGYETHMLRNVKNNDEVNLPDAEWAEVEKGRMIWAEKGCIMTGCVSKDGLQGQAVLLDTNPFTFEEIIAPY